MLWLLFSFFVFYLILPTTISVEDITPNKVSRPLVSSPFRYMRKRSTTASLDSIFASVPTSPTTFISVSPQFPKQPSIRSPSETHSFLEISNTSLNESSVPSVIYPTSFTPFPPLLLNNSSLQPRSRSYRRRTTVSSVLSSSPFLVGSSTSPESPAIRASSPSSSSGSVLPFPNPKAFDAFGTSKPQIVEVRTYSRQIFIRWTAPSLALSGIVDKYALKFGEKGPFDAEYEFDASQTSCYIWNLAPETQHMISLSACNSELVANGKRQCSGPVMQDAWTQPISAPECEPPAPVAFDATSVSSSEIGLKWQDNVVLADSAPVYYGPPNDGSGPLFISPPEALRKRYQINYAISSQHIPADGFPLQAHALRPRVIESNTTSCVISGLWAYTTYEFTVTLIIGRQSSHPSLILLKQTLEALSPAAPSHFKFTPSSLLRDRNGIQIMCEFSRPSPPNGYVLEYELQYAQVLPMSSNISQPGRNRGGAESGASDPERRWFWQTVMVHGNSRAKQQVLVTLLAPSADGTGRTPAKTPYAFRARARNTIGYSPFSDIAYFDLLPLENYQSLPSDGFSPRDPKDPALDYSSYNVGDVDYLPPYDVAYNGVYEEDVYEIYHESAYNAARDHAAEAAKGNLTSLPPPNSNANASRRPASTSYDPYLVQAGGSTPQGTNMYPYPYPYPYPQQAPGQNQNASSSASALGYPFMSGTLFGIATELWITLIISVLGFAFICIVVLVLVIVKRRLDYRRLKREHARLTFNSTLPHATSTMDANDSDEQQDSRDPDRDRLPPRPQPCGNITCMGRNSRSPAQNLPRSESARFYKGRAQLNSATSMPLLYDPNAIAPPAAGEGDGDTQKMQQHLQQVQNNLDLNIIRMNERARLLQMSPSHPNLHELQLRHLDISQTQPLLPSSQQGQQFSSPHSQQLALQNSNAIWANEISMARSFIQPVVTLQPENDPHALAQGAFIGNPGAQRRNIMVTSINTTPGHNRPPVEPSLQMSTDFAQTLARQQSNANTNSFVGDPSQTFSLSGASTGTAIRVPMGVGIGHSASTTYMLNLGAAAGLGNRLALQDQAQLPVSRPVIFPLDLPENNSAILSSQGQFFTPSIEGIQQAALMSSMQSPLQRHLSKRRLAGAVESPTGSPIDSCLTGTGSHSRSNLSSPQPSFPIGLAASGSQPYAPYYQASVANSSNPSAIVPATVPGASRPTYMSSSLQSAQLVPSSSVTPSSTGPRGNGALFPMNGSLAQSQNQNQNPMVQQSMQPLRESHMLAPDAQYSNIPYSESKPEHQTQMPPTTGASSRNTLTRKRSSHKSRDSSGSQQRAPDTSVCGPMPDIVGNYPRLLGNTAVPSGVSLANPTSLNGQFSPPSQSAGGAQGFSPQAKPIEYIQLVNLNPVQPAQTSIFQNAQGESNHRIPLRYSLHSESNSQYPQSRKINSVDSGCGFGMGSAFGSDRSSQRAAGTSGTPGAISEADTEEAREELGDQQPEQSTDSNALSVTIAKIANFDQDLREALANGGIH